MLQPGGTSNGWQPQFRVNESPLTAAQLAALNSGATAELIEQISKNTAAIALKYSKPSGGIPASDLAPGVIPSIPDPSSTTPVMDGVPSAGSSAAYARGDHVHPADTSRLAANQGMANAGKFMVVGSDGIVAPVTMQTWQGGSY